MKQVTITWMMLPLSLSTGALKMSWMMVKGKRRGGADSVAAVLQDKQVWPMTATHSCQEFPIQSSLIATFSILAWS